MNPSPQPEPAPPDGVRVLLLESDPADAERMLGHLRLDGFDPSWRRVDCEEDFRDALDGDPEPDLVLAELALPGLPVSEALSLIGESDRDIPVIVVTGRPEEEALEALRLGAADYLLKDRLARLSQAVRRALESVRLRRQSAKDLAALRESQARHSLLFEKNLAGIYVSTPEGRILECNRAFASILGLDTVEEVRASEAGAFYPDPAAREAFVDRVRRERRIFPPVEVELRLAEDETRHILESAVGVFDSAGGLEEIVGYVIDITIDVSARRRMKTQRDSLSDIVEQAAEAVIITDLEGKITYVNQALEGMSGYSKEEVIGKNPRIFKSGEHDEPFYRDMWSTLVQGKTWSGRITNRRKDGSRYVADATISGVLNDRGELALFVAFEKDVTREVELEEKLMGAGRLEAVGRLAGGVAHDFNNLLTVITASTDLALKSLEDGDGLEQDLKEIDLAARRGAELVEKLLAFGRKQIIHPEPLDPNALVSEVAAMLHRVIREDIEIRVDLDEDVSPLFADSAQLQGVLLNLCINARDAMPGGGVLTLRTRNVALDEEFAATHPGAVPGDFVMLSVDDTGHGMDKETQERVFEPFFTTKESGTGMGLASAYGAIKQEGGTIRVHSEPGRGTRFKIYLPPG